MGCVYVYVILLTFLGPEALGRDFHVETDQDMAAAANAEAMRAAGAVARGGRASSDEGSAVEKGQHVEKELEAEPRRS